MVYVLASAPRSEQSKTKLRLNDIFHEIVTTAYWNAYFRDEITISDHVGR
jgi:hypothetical protein